MSPGRTALLLLALLPGLPLAEAQTESIQPPPVTRGPVDLERELQAPWQAGGEILLHAAADGGPRAGRLPSPPADAGGERARRAELFALARKLNLVLQPRVAPLALPLAEDQVALLERFAHSDAGAVWFREMADDTLRLFNQGYLEYDAALWRAYLEGGPRPPLSALITGRMSEAGLFAQDAAVFRIYAYDGMGSMAAAASVRMGRKGFRCQFSMSGEAVDPFAILSHEFGHSRYGDPRSAGHSRRRCCQTWCRMGSRCARAAWQTGSSSGSSARRLAASFTPIIPCAAPVAISARACAVWLGFTTT